jgi:ABC-type multidrug transport system ATPase subunit
MSTWSDNNNHGFAQVQSMQVNLGKNKDPKVLLHPMKILFPENQVTAIMGPSGSGKTTLMNFLTGSVSKGVQAKGQISLPGQMAFVPQHDQLHGFFTCRWYMKHYTHLVGLEANSDNENHVMKLLSSLGMEKHADTIVGDVFRKGLSGGQQRRLSVALEALSSPEVFCLDEPTSGLDSESAYQVMHFLKEYARAAGKRVILTIHQPSSFVWQLIDNVVLLSEGKLVYQGPRVNMERFFEVNGCPCPQEYNPADHYLTSVTSEFHSNEKSIDEWALAYIEWEKSAEAANDAESPGKVYDLNRDSTNAESEISVRSSSRGSAFSTTLELVRRYTWNLYLNPGIIGTRVVMYSMLSLMIGVLFWDLGDKTTYSSVTSRIGLLFYCVAFFVFMSVAALPFAVMERGIVEKEIRNGYYHPICFQVAQFITSLPGTFLLAIMTTVIVVSMTGLKEPIFYALNMFLALTCAEGLSQLVSYLVPHYIIGLALVAGFYGFFMLLQGFLIIPSEFPSWIEWAYYIPFHTYSWRSFMVKEFGGEGVTFDSEDKFATGMDVLKAYEIESVDPNLDMLYLVIYICIINVISFAVLHVKHVSHNRRQISVMNGGR